jgi:hypothetical protein
MPTCGVVLGCFDSRCWRVTPSRGRSRGIATAQEGNHDTHGSRAQRTRPPLSITTEHLPKAQRNTPTECMWQIPRAVCFAASFTNTAHVSSGCSHDLTKQSPMLSNTGHNVKHCRGRHTPPQHFVVSKLPPQRRLTAIPGELHHHWRRVMQRSHEAEAEAPTLRRGTRSYTHGQVHAVSASYEQLA